MSLPLKNTPVRTLRESFTIAFSPRLAAAPITQKQNALVALLEEIENHSTIEPESVDGIHIVETIYSLLVSFVEKRDTLKNYRLTIAVHELDHNNISSLEKLGFDVYQKRQDHFMRAV